MTRFREWDIDRNSVDVLVGGTPCQSFSVAGLRKGLDDSRGNLALTFIAMVEHFKPEWVIWENVPGVLSSSGGRDFGSFLGALGQLGYGFAYRVLDAQYFGVPQRRRRVFVVAHSSGDSRRAAEVLFEPESLRGNHKTSRAQGQGIADASITGTVSSKWAKGTGGPAGDECYNLVPVMYQHNQTDARLKIEPKTSQTVIARFGTGGGHTPLVRHHVLVRKLTPTECERLQGFPDGYTNIMPNTPDGSRYVALGNSMAVPVMRWIGKRIAGI
jgi:DNA (cytosine-5)-methyltransferase 1